MAHSVLVPLACEIVAAARRWPRGASELEVYGPSAGAGPDADAQLLFERCIAKRPLVFMGPNDKYVLRSGASGPDGRELFDRCGGADESPDVSLRNYLSYDEMQLSALLAVSVPTHFINTGGRHNAAVPGVPGSFEPRGICKCERGRGREHAQAAQRGRALLLLLLLLLMVVLLLQLQPLTTSLRRGAGRLALRARRAHGLVPTCRDARAEH